MSLLRITASIGAVHLGEGYLHGCQRKTGLTRVKNKKKRM